MISTLRAIAVLALLSLAACGQSSPATTTALDKDKENHGKPGTTLPDREGCSFEPAQAFYSDGSPASAKGAPVPCAVMTGFGGSESRVSVAPNGDILQTPAVVSTGTMGTPVPAVPEGPTPNFVFFNNAGIGYSHDNGRTWQLMIPNGDLGVQGDNDLYIDRYTSRLYYSRIFGALPAPLSAWSVQYAPDGQIVTAPPSPSGSGWGDWHSTTMYGYLSENPRFATAPAAPDQPQPAAGESVALWCANLLNVPNAAQRVCNRSLDGGISWAFASILASTPPQHGECGTSGEYTGFSDNYARGTDDGSFYVMIQCNGHNYLARSTDEGATWPIMKLSDGSLVEIPGAPTKMHVDHVGNVYAFEVKDGNLLMVVSRDHGGTWQGPFNLAPPNVRAIDPSTLPPATNPLVPVAFPSAVPLPSGGTVIRQWDAINGWEPGIVGAAYLVARADGSGYDAYITATRTALDDKPVFYTARIQHPQQPPGGPMVENNIVASDDFITLDVGPDGRPWAGFYSACVKDSAGNYVEGFCQQTGGERWVPAPPFYEPDTGKAMTIGSLRW